MNIDMVTQNKFPLVFNIAKVIGEIYPHLLYKHWYKGNKLHKA